MFTEKGIFFYTQNLKLRSFRVFEATEMIFAILETLYTWLLGEEKIFSIWPIFHHLRAIF